MAYLTFVEFEELGGSESVDEEKFKKLLPLASSILDIKTNNFYRFHDLEKDKVLFRKERFKLAVIAQINFFDEVKAVSQYGLENKPMSFTVGRTRVDSGNSHSKHQSQADLFSHEAYTLLEGTGLLYRGVY